MSNKVFIGFAVGLLSLTFVIVGIWIGLFLISPTVDDPGGAPTYPDAPPVEVREIDLSDIETRDQAAQRVVSNSAIQGDLPLPRNADEAVPVDEPSAHEPMEATSSDESSVEVRGQVTISGGGATGGAGRLSASLVRSRIAARRRLMQRCYEQALRPNADLSGRVTASFTVTSEGGVSGLSVSGNADLARCVGNVIRRIRFPAPEGGSVRFRFPIAFTRAN